MAPIGKSYLELRFMTLREMWPNKRAIYDEQGFPTYTPWSKMPRRLQGQWSSCYYIRHIQGSALKCPRCELEERAIFS